MEGILWLSVNSNLTVQPRFATRPNHLHVTLQYGVQMTDDIQSLLGREVQALLLSDCWNEQIQAVTVKLPSDVKALCKNRYPHITVSMVEGVKPVASNEMLSSSHNHLPVVKPVSLVFDFFRFS